MKRYNKGDPMPREVLEVILYLVEPSAINEPGRLLAESLAQKSGARAYFNYDPTTTLPQITQSEFYGFANLRNALGLKIDLLREDSNRLIFGMKVRPGDQEKAESTFEQTPLNSFEKSLISRLNPRTQIEGATFG